MFGTNRKGVSAYASVGIETGVAAASPHQLIVMLFDGACVAIRSAMLQMQNGDVAGKGAAISKAITIIENGLRASLDKKTGGEIAANLDALYEYMGRRLLQANLENNAEMLEEVRKLLADLRETWIAITPKAEQQPAQPHAANYSPKLVSA
jgi:flagellar protein FliS